MSWILIVVLVNGSYGNPVVTIPGFGSENACRVAADYAMKKQTGDTRVRDAFCLSGPSTHDSRI